MNAKFEKWCHHERDLGHFIDMSKCGDGSYVSSRTAELSDLWMHATKDAIQSLEVTPELVEVAYQASRVNAGESLPWLSRKIVSDGLHAFISALKEQAK